MTAMVADLVRTPDWFNQALAVEARAASTVVDGAKIAYRTWGEGTRSVILIHGGAAHSGWWDHIAPLLGAGREVIALDLSGHGESDVRESYSVDHWAAEVLAVAGLASSAAPILIGHSLGGVVGLRAAMASGAGLGGIIIVDSPLVHFTPEEDAAADRLAFGPPRLYPTRESVVSRFRPIPDQLTLDYVATHVANTSVREVPGGWSWKFDSKIFDRAPQLPELIPLACQSAFFRGENGLVGTDMADEIFRRLGSATPMIEMPAAGHHPMLDQPLALVAGLRTLLAAWEHQPPA
jgi:pimeloyl-ACP methyl ester carboxylesterase